MDKIYSGLMNEQDIRRYIETRTIGGYVDPALVALSLGLMQLEELRKIRGALGSLKKDAADALRASDPRLSSEWFHNGGR